MADLAPHSGADHLHLVTDDALPFAGPEHRNLMDTLIVATTQNHYRGLFNAIDDLDSVLRHQGLPIGQRESVGRTHRVGVTAMWQFVASEPGVLPPRLVRHDWVEATHRPLKGSTVIYPDKTEWTMGMGFWLRRYKGFSTDENSPIASEHALKPRSAKGLLAMVYQIIEDRT